MKTYKQFLESSGIHGKKRLDEEGWRKCDPHLLIRALGIPKERKTINQGPIEGGLFLSLADAHDIPSAFGPFVYAESTNLIKHGTLWMQNINNPGSWEKINGLEQMNMFKVDHLDNPDSFSITIRIKPFAPEFYFVPNKTKRGKRIYNKLIGR